MHTQDTQGFCRLMGAEADVVSAAIANVAAAAFILNKKQQKQNNNNSKIDKSKPN